MKKSIKILTTLFFVLLFCLPVLAEGYSVLVIPNSCVVSDQKHVVGNVDIEELLARKFIDKFEATGNDYAPTLRVLQISIKNNPDFNKNAVDKMENAKILSASYGVPKVLLISSRIENKTDRKKYQNRTDLPILTQQNTNTRVITKLTMYNTKTNKVIWSDVYYKNIDALACTNIGIINAYYDELIPKALANIRATKETHAVIVGNNRTDSSQTRTVTNTASAKTTPAKTTIIQKQPATVTTAKELKPIKQELVKSNSSVVEKKNLTTPVANITPDLRMKDEINKKPVSSPKKPSKLAQAKTNLQTKYNNYKHEKEMAELEKVSKPTPAKTQTVATKQEKNQIVAKQKEVKPEKTVTKPEPKKVAEQKTVQTNEAKTKSAKQIMNGNEEEKTLAQWLKERHQQENKTELKQEPKTAKIKPVKTQTTKTEPKKEIVKKEQPKETKTVVKKQENIKPTIKQKIQTIAKQKEIKPEKTVTKPEPTKVAEQKKVVKEQPKKEIKTAAKKDKEKFSAKIKSKYTNLKAKYDEHKTQKIKTSEENVKYSTVILKNDESTSSANRYINTRPRYNSVNYTPEFDTSVNDI